MNPVDGARAETRGEYSNPVVGAVLLWWVALLCQVVFAWDLSEFYAGFPTLLRVGTETPFAVVGVIGALLGLGLTLRERARIATVWCAATVAMAGWLLVDSPVFGLGARLYLWQHEAVFLTDAQWISENAPEAPRFAVDAPSGRRVHVETDPLRIGFERRVIGMVHWAELVYAPDEELEVELTGELATIFGYTALGCGRLWGDWYVVAAIK